MRINEDSERRMSPDQGLAARLGSVHSIFTSANGVIGVPVQAQDAGQTGRLAKECNAEWHGKRPVPFGLRPKKPCAALQSLAGRAAPASFCAWIKAFLPSNASCKNTVNRPYDQVLREKRMPTTGATHDA